MRVAINNFAMVLLLAGCVLLASPETSRAQVQASDNPVAEGVEDQEQRIEIPADPASIKKAKQQARDASRQNDEDFIPSEEISEDLPVPFPVDI
ncbi:hypothetical protein [Arenicella xantha]|nr:hypothetical protein [Arenicella xantha]